MALITLRGSDQFNGEIGARLYVMLRFQIVRVETLLLWRMRLALRNFVHHV
jgi:hypothetical protein